MPHLLARHARASVLASTLSLLQHIQRCRDANEARRATTKNPKSGFQFCFIPQDQVKNDVELGAKHARQGRAQVFTVDVIRLLPFLVASHVATVRHGYERIERHVECGRWRGSLQRFGDRRLSRARGAVQDDDGRLHSV